MVLLIAVALAFACAGRIIFRKWYNPVSIFCFLWMVIFILYLLRLEPYYDISGRTELIFLLQLVGFSFGGMIAYSNRVRITPQKQIPETNGEKTNVRELRYGIYFLLCAYAIYVLWGDTAQIIEALRMGMTFDEMEMAGIITEGDNTGFRVFEKIFIMFPVTYSISAVAATELLLTDGKKEKKHWILLVLNIVIVLLYSLQHGARIMLFVFFITYISAYILSGKANKYIKVIKKIVLVLCIVTAVLCIYLSVSRGIDTKELLMSIYHYFTACVSHFHVVINKISRDLTYTFGCTSLNGFLSPIIILLKSFGILSKTPYLCQLASKYIMFPEEVSVIGNGVSMNAFITSSYTFYIDGGYAGVLVGMFLYGYIAANTYMIAKNHTSTKNYAIYMLLLSTIYMSFARFQFCQYQTAMALVLCFFIYKKEKKI